jgi:hypothetical protein
LVFFRLSEPNEHLLVLLVLVSRGGRVVELLIDAHNEYLDGVTDDVYVDSNILFYCIHFLVYHKCGHYHHQLADDDL